MNTHEGIRQITTCMSVPIAFYIHYDTQNKQSSSPSQEYYRERESFFHLHRAYDNFQHAQSTRIETQQQQITIQTQTERMPIITEAPSNPTNSIRNTKPLPICNSTQSTKRERQVKCKQTSTVQTLTALIVFFAWVLIAAFPFMPSTDLLFLVLSRMNTTAAITRITITTAITIPITGRQLPVAFCYSPSLLPSTHALVCVPT